MHLNTINFQPFNRTEQETGASLVPPLKLTYNFDYQTFHSSDLTELAKTTLGNFMGFVRVTFDGLLENGKALQNLYYECIAICPDGKKVFEEWLATDFAASRYVAESAMKISAWFEKLPVRLQCLIRQHVQQWKISTLRQLTRVTENLLEEVVTSGKKTAAQVKRFTVQNKSAASKKASSDKVFNNTESVTQPTVENSNCDEGLATKDLRQRTCPFYLLSYQRLFLLMYLRLEYVSSFKTTLVDTITTVESSQILVTMMISGFFWITL